MFSEVIFGRFCKSTVYKSFVRSYSATMSSKSNRSRMIAICQVCSTSDLERNYEVVDSLVKEATANGASMVFLPEAFDYVATHRDESVKMASGLDGTLLSRYRKLAAENVVWLSLGGFHQSTGSDKILNTHIIVDSNGEIVSLYNKSHLFDVDLPGGGSLRESSYVIPGNKIGEVVDTPAGKVGLAICYDLRFAELALMLRSAGADIITYPSAFSYTTGAQHWEILLRARAIETQTYVVAAAQYGRHNSERTSWGHAMVVDPEGTIVAQCSRGNGIAMARIDLQLIETIRRDMPVMNHRRTDIYPPLKINSFAPSDSDQSFGEAVIPKEIIFCATSHSYAFTNRSCVLPGHVLIACKRTGIPMLSDLSPVEVADLFSLVQRVELAVSRFYGATSSTISIQNGPLAGQTVPHVHVHILPRKDGDFKSNDDVYVALEMHDKGGQKWRDLTEMTEEATKLRQFMLEA